MEEEDAEVVEILNVSPPPPKNSSEETDPTYKPPTKKVKKVTL